ncbi:MAG: DUF5615 family PIN-like protein [Chloroflexota bacterium]|nr:DUF5615 family PIN-like protein [Chloroflexota bacterium]
MTGSNGPRSRQCSARSSSDPGVKVVLDAHISGRTVGRVLRDDGLDVLALDATRVLKSLRDPDVLALAAAEGRVLVTANVRDFDPLLKWWAADGRSHAGIILVPRSIRNEDFGLLISGIRTLLADTKAVDWIDRVAWLSRS